MAAGQGENVLQDMFVHTPRIISRIEQMGNATISSLNVSTAPDVSRSLKTINQSILQEEIKHLKETKTMLVPNSSKKPFLARSGRGQNNKKNNRHYYYHNQASVSFPLQNKINRRGGTTTNLSTRKPKRAGNRCKSEH